MFDLGLQKNLATRGANPVSSWGGGGMIGKILPKFAISRVCGV